MHPTSPTGASEVESGAAAASDVLAPPPPPPPDVRPPVATMAPPLEEILNKLLMADNAVIQEGTKELGEALKNPGVVGDLCRVMGTSTAPQVRQYAAVILRKRLGKGRHWTKLDADVKNGIKEGVLQALMQEPESSVRNAIAQFVGVIARHELPAGNWPALLQFIQQMIQSQNTQERQLGVYVVSVVSGVAGDQLLPHLGHLLTLFSTTLEDTTSPTAFHTIQALTNFAPLVGQENMTEFQALLPKVLEAVKALLTQDEDQAAEAMELFDVLAECEVALLVPHLRPVIQLCLDVTSNAALGESVRVKAITFLGYITRLKKKYIVKNKLVVPLVTVMFNVACSENGEEDCLGFFGGEDGEGGSPMHAAAQTLDACALHLPPDKLLPCLMGLVEPALKSGNPHQVKGAYLALAMVAEGCSDTLRMKHLHPLLQCICHGITNENQLVRNSALFALGQFAEHLQPDISKYHAELLPVLFQYLTQTCIVVGSGGSDPPGVDRMFYALEVFCENLEAELLPHLPSLMERLLAVLAAPTSVHMKELAISAIGATANAAKEHMAPYFQQIVEMLKGYLTEDQTEETMTLQVQSIDTLGQLARCMGVENFSVYAPDCVALGLGLMERKDDPDVRKTCYLLFASLASVMKGDMAPHLPKVMKNMMMSLRSTDGVVTHFKDEEGGLPTTIEGLSDSEEEEGEVDVLANDEPEDEDVAGYSVENAFLEEKEDTCVALRELSLHCGDSFLPYTDTCGEEVYKMLNYPSEDVRQAAVGAMAQFVNSLAKSSAPEAAEGFKKWIQVLIPKLSELIRTDEERSVVMACLEAYAEVLKEAGAPVLVPQGHLEAIINCVKDVMLKKTMCQDMADEAGSEDEGEAEHDEMLVEYAGEVVPSLGKAMPQAEFATQFAQLLPLFANKTKKSCSVAERSFSLGTLAEAVEALGSASGQFVPQLLPLFQQGAADEDDEVRSNAIYGLGVLGQHGGEAITGHYNNILATLSAALSKETFPRALDNICGAVARLISTSPSNVPLEQVFPVVLGCLPLREDFAENPTVFECFLVLYRMQHPLLAQNLVPILRLAALIYTTKQADDKTNQLIQEFVASVNRDFPDQVSSLAQNLEPELKARLEAAAAAGATLVASPPT
ncbi:importin-4 [Penaeus vannamei]|uniref:importin-4 n=1 Tax=Penaeus vannamei TaxID=6689 RepID=UPI00387FA951